jgi:hypothetical protein
MQISIDEERNQQERKNRVKRLVKYKAPFSTYKTFKAYCDYHETHTHTHKRLTSI